MVVTITDMMIPIAILDDTPVPNITISIGPNATLGIALKITR